MSDKHTDDMFELFNLEAKRNGIACITTNDGHFLRFTRAMIEKMLNDHPTQDEFLVLVKRSDFKSQS